MASIGEQVLEAIVTALGGAGKPSTLTFERGRIRPIEESEAPIGIIGWITDAKVQVVLGAIPQEERSRRVRVMLVGLGTDQDLDAFMVWIDKALKADTTLGGLARNLEYVSSTPDLRLVGVQIAAAAIDYDVTYRQKLRDPEAQA